MWPFDANVESQRNITKKHRQRSADQTSRSWDLARCQRYSALIKAFSPQWWTLDFLSSHSSELFVFRYLKQIKVILYCSRSSLNCDLSKITSVWNAKWTFTVPLNNFNFVEQYLSCSSYVTYLFLLTMFCSPHHHNLGYNPWNYRLFPLQCSLENLLLL